MIACRYNIPKGDWSRGSGMPEEGKVVFKKGNLVEELSRISKSGQCS